MPLIHCVNSNNNKLVFASGVRVTVQSRTEHKPSYFRVGEPDDAACLATGFSRHNATSSHVYFKTPNMTKAVAISPNLDLYNQVVFPGGNANEMWTLHFVVSAINPGSGDKKCVDVLEPDPKVNLMSLTILALRVIFIKTIIFNIIMTLRLWISQ
ncbi:M1-specific T cell receptor alpha chain-like [Simochromis diagramma]|uniref:M1-specific T cell receptor alpha chain-like n=1 Tax=Simochromis diagramma TaxID=43689 RepID=UPI001A7EA993|nr:M1-specific T cell receptor alpha chain-like [Simochromis diagramma]